MLRIGARPGQVGSVGADSLRVVMRQQGSMLVAAATERLEPAGDARVQPQPSRLRKRAVGDLAGQRVLERQLPHPLERRARMGPDEIALLQQLEVGQRVPEQLAHGLAPERAPDHRGGLERVLLERRKTVDPRGHDSLHGVGDRRGVSAGADLGHQLLDEEWVPFGLLEHRLADVFGRLGDEPCGVVGRQRLEPHG